MPRSPGREARQGRTPAELTRGTRRGLFRALCKTNSFHPCDRRGVLMLSRPGTDGDEVTLAQGHEPAGEGQACIFSATLSLKVSHLTPTTSDGERSARFWLSRLLRATREPPWPLALQDADRGAHRGPPPPDPLEGAARPLEFLPPPLPELRLRFPPLDNNAETPVPKGLCARLRGSRDESPTGDRVPSSSWMLTAQHGNAVTPPLHTDAPALGLPPLSISPGNFLEGPQPRAQLRFRGPLQAVLTCTWHPTPRERTPQLCLCL